MEQELGFPASANAARSPQQEPQSQSDAEFEAMVKAAEEFDDEGAQRPPEPTPEWGPPR